MPRWGDVVYVSQLMGDLVERLQRVVARSEPVLLLGERGCGKGVLARALHVTGPRATGPFVEINCATVPPELAEAQLFGHQRGAFTGATEACPGCFEAADGGIVFLDEIGDLPAGMQAKLLTVIEGRTVRRLGSVRDLNVDFRLVTATNRDLFVEGGPLREDLRDRLSIFRFDVPPLRSRREDISHLAAEFYQREVEKEGRGRSVVYPEKIPPETLEVFSRYDWPGNVRELGAAVVRLVAFSPDGEFSEEDARLAIEMGAASRRPANAAPLPSEGFSLTAHIEQEKQRFVDAALAATHGNIAHAARMLGMSKQVLHKYLGKRQREEPDKS